MHSTRPENLAGPPTPHPLKAGRPACSMRPRSWDSLLPQLGRLSASAWSASCCVCVGEGVCCCECGAAGACCSACCWGGGAGTCCPASAMLSCGTAVDLAAPMLHPLLPAGAPFSMGCSVLPASTPLSKGCLVLPAGTSRSQPCPTLLPSNGGCPVASGRCCWWGGGAAEAGGGDCKPRPGSVGAAEAGGGDCKPRPGSVCSGGRAAA